MEDTKYDYVILVYIMNHVDIELFETENRPSPGRIRPTSCTPETVITLIALTRRFVGDMYARKVCHNVRFLSNPARLHLAARMEDFGSVLC